MNISNEAIVGIISTLLGTVLGWALSLITNNTGRIHMEIENYDYKSSDLSDTLSFELVVYNGKNSRSGINDCKVIVVNSSDIEMEFLHMFDNEHTINELDNLLNVDVKTVKKAKYCQSGLQLDNISEIYLRYKVNGKKKIKKLQIKRSKR